MDDSAIAREAEAALLRSLGHEVDEAVDGEDGWQRLQGGGFQLLVTDVQMPVLDGIDLTRRVQGHAALPQLPILILSSLSAPEERRRGVDAGADAYLVKGELDAEDAGRHAGAALRGRGGERGDDRRASASWWPTTRELFRELLSRRDRRRARASRWWRWRPTANDAAGPGPRATARRHHHGPQHARRRRLLRHRADHGRDPHAHPGADRQPGRGVGFKALSLGALDILEKPDATEDLEAYGAEIRSQAAAPRRGQGHPPRARPARAQLPPPARPGGAPSWW